MLTGTFDTFTTSDDAICSHLFRNTIRSEGGKNSNFNFGADNNQHISRVAYFIRPKWQSVTRKPKNNSVPNLIIERRRRENFDRKISAPRHGTNHEKQGKTWRNERTGLKMDNLIIQKTDQKTAEHKFIIHYMYTHLTIWSQNTRKHAELFHTTFAVFKTLYLFFLWYSQQPV